MNPYLLWFLPVIGLDPFWRGWLEPTCIGCGSADFTSGAEWILKLRGSKSASSISNQKKEAIE